MTSEPTTSGMLTELGACAYRLGVAFAEQAEAEAVWARKLELFQLFDRCFSGFRISVALDLRLRQEARRHGATGARPTPSEREPAEHPPAEREAPERERVDYDRDRETATLPVLLKTLNGVVAAADALPGPPPAELPTLRELLARIGATGASATQSPPGSRPPDPGSGPGALRARLAGSAGVALARPPDPPRPRTPPGPSPLAVPRRPATGPPPHR
ncbi:hypothetical protein [Phenylobacterium sp.]|uniref:hypothetical protein n=1 Tax=Phenylobacterium sp. TaxID=1871053 RepID=UPI00301C97A5